MKSGRWRLIEELYHSAADLPDGERHSFLHGACGEDQSLFQEVESLLRHGSSPQSVLDTLAIAVMAKTLAADEDAASAPSLEGMTISHYRVLGAIGRGGMGMVYKAEDLKLRRNVALKLLPRFLARDPEALQRFEREAQAASALNHPNICTVYEIDEANGLHFIAIELLDGETLKERIARGPLAVPEMLSIVMEICDALEAAHSAGIIHRDIKPSNILLTRRGTAKLLDFGVAKRIGQDLVRQTEDRLSLVPQGADLRLTIPGAAIGTVAYMSPEQASSQEVDARSDLFSLGTVLYEMTTGKGAFPGKDLADVVRAIQKQPVASIGQLNPKTSSELIRIINKAMQKDRSLRYQRAAEMQSDLWTLRRRLEARISKRKALLMSVLIVVFFAIVVVTLIKVSRAREWVAGKAPASAQQEIKSLAVLPLENLTGDSSQDYFVDGMTDALITDLTKIGSLQVISHTSAMHYKGTHKTLPEIARELNVNAVVEGFVSRSGNRVRISAQLVDAAKDQNLWARDYDRDLQDVLLLQSELATAIAQEVAGKLTPQEQTRLLGRAVNSEAYEDYLRGRYCLNIHSADGIQKAKKYFEQAIQKDPNYAPAYAGLAATYNLMTFSLELTLEADVGATKAIEAAKKALELDANLAEAHVELGATTYRYSGDWVSAEKEFQRAIQLNPSFAKAYVVYGGYLVSAGRDEQACVNFRTAHELDPQDPSFAKREAECLFREGKFEQAIAEARTAVDLEPGNLGSRYTLAGIYEQKGRFAEAIGEYRKLVEVAGGDECAKNVLVHALAASGRSTEAEKLLDEVKAGPDGDDPYCLALAYVGFGRQDEAIRSLEKAFREGNPGKSIIYGEWRFAPLRSDSRFQALLRRAGVPGW
jgi:eukaryotic-like serine/threonine-protein kinase